MFLARDPTGPLRPNDRLVVGANMGYYQEAYRTTPFDRFFVDWEVRGGLDDYRVFEIETLGHYDVRVANRPDRIAPLYLYRMPRTGGDPKVLYEIDVRPELLGAPFSLLPGKYTATLTLKSAPPDKVEFQILTNDAAPLKTDVKTQETTVDFTVSNGPVQFILNSRLGITSFWQGLTIQHH